MGSMSCLGVGLRSLSAYLVYTCNALTYKEVEEKYAVL